MEMKKEVSAQKVKKDAEELVDFFVRKPLYLPSGTTLNLMFQIWWFLWPLDFQLESDVPSAYAAQYPEVL